MTDPNWLLSTTAQSAAALVAIVGGFLVSRVIAFSTERQGLRNRRAELGRQIELAQQELDDATEEVARDLSRLFQEWALDDYLLADGNFKVEDSLDKHWPRGADEDEVLAWGNQLNGWIRDATSDVDGVLGPRELTIDIDTLRNRGVDVDRFPTAVLERVIEWVTSARARANPLAAAMTSFGSIRPLHLPALVEREQRDRRERIARKRDARGRLAGLTAQAEVLDHQLAALARPAGLRGAVAVLSYFSAVGIVLPLVVMSLRPVPHGWRMRALVVGLFASGLLALLGYVGSAIRSARD